MGKKTRNIFIKHNGPIQEGHEIHHIIPRHAGGSDELTNLISLSLEDHALAHKLLFEQNGKKEDLWAFQFLSGQTTEARLTRASMGGKKGGVVQRDLGIGIHRGTAEEKKQRMLVARKIQDETKTNMFVYCDKEVQSSRGKRGGVKNKGFIWYNDGSRDLKYTTSAQRDKPFEEFLAENPDLSKGRIAPVDPIICPFCKKLGTSLPAMRRHHFNNCKENHEN